jgi:hypothetical protein
MPQVGQAPTTSTQLGAGTTAPQQSMLPQLMAQGSGAQTQNFLQALRPLWQ